MNVHVKAYLEQVIEWHMVWMKIFPIKNKGLPMKLDKNSKNLESTQLDIAVDGEMDQNFIKGPEKNSVLSIDLRQEMSFLQWL